MHPCISLLAAFAATAVAETIVINAGKGGFTFSPDSVTASVGDTLEFHFFGSIHTAVQGDFSTPCQMGSLLGSGFDSGPISNKADGSGSVFQVTVQSTDPMWFYCVTPTHCQGGMVGVVNPPSSGNSLATYKANAAGTSSSQSVGKVQGGVVVPAGEGEGSSSSSSKATTPLASSTTPSSSAPAPTSPSGSSSVASSKTASSQNSGSSSVAGGTPSSSSNASSISGSATSSASTTPTFVTTSEGGSMMGMTGKTVLFRAVFGLGVFAALMA